MSNARASIDFAPLHAALWPPGAGGGHIGRTVYAVLDGARDPDVLPLIERSRADYRCLYAGPLAPALAAVAPYLVRMRPDAPSTQPLLERAIGSSWGIFAAADEDIEAMRRHFRRLLRVRTEDGKTLLFRFYDPRVLRLYLPTCTDAELEEVFGPVHEYLYEDEEADKLIASSRLSPGIQSESLTLR